MKKVVIIGAGPAGLTAAYELMKNKSYEVIVLEESEDFGGISKTINVNGNRMDIGGHRFFSKDKRVTDWWEAILKPQAKASKDDILLNRTKLLAEDGNDPETDELVMLLRERVSRIFYKNTFFDYPVTFNLNTISNMGFFTSLRAGFSYLYSVLKKLPEDNLENFYINRFGKVLYSMFFEGYTEKLWGRHPKGISAEWGSQRVKGLSIKAIFKDILGKLFGIKNKHVETSLIEQFYYPKYGPGQMWTAVADEVSKMGGLILTDKRVNQIMTNSEGQIGKIICNDATEFCCDILISTMPLKDFVYAIDDASDDVRRVAEALPYRDFQTVGVLLPIDKFLLRNFGKAPTVGGIAPDCWIYVQDASVLLGRIQIFNNWSPYMVDDFEHNVWIGLEYFCNEGDYYWEMSDEEFTAFALDELVKIGVIASDSDVLSTHRERVKKAYPAYFDTYKEFATLRSFLDSIPNLYCIGRNGQHRYNNMDHSMVTAFEAVDNIILGKIGNDNIWNVNTEQEYNEINKTKHSHS